MRLGKSTTVPARGRLLVTRRNSRLVPVFAVLTAVLGAIFLFLALEERRAQVGIPQSTRATDAGLITSPPELFVPDPPVLDLDVEGDGFFPHSGLADPPTPSESLLFNRDVERPPPRRERRPGPENGSHFADSYSAPPDQPQLRDGADVPPALPPLGRRLAPTAGGVQERVEATRLERPATTIPKGAMIHAVLETAINSSWGGPVRAIVSRDARGFDGTLVLVPRGSRLYGEYKPELAAGQSRMLIQWQRLTRPDGAIIALDSPSADGLGRAGIKGSVNSHFFERFGGAILQSALDVGVAMAGRNGSVGPVIIGMPGSTTQRAGQVNVADVRRTIKVKQGSAVSVFVARDLDFTGVQ